MCIHHCCTFWLKKIKPFKCKFAVCLFKGKELIKSDEFFDLLGNISRIFQCVILVDVTEMIASFGLLIAHAIARQWGWTEIPFALCDIVLVGAYLLTTWYSNRDRARAARTAQARAEGGEASRSALLDARTPDVVEYFY